MAQDGQDKRNLFEMMAIFMTIPFVLAVPPVIGLLVGKGLDKLLGTEPWFMYGMCILGFVAGGREFIRIIKKYGDTRGTGL